MANFAVIFHKQDPEDEERLKEAYPAPDHLLVEPGVYLISGDLLIEDIVERLGLTGEGDRGAVVFRLNGTYGGRTYGRVWDWLARSATIA